MTEIENKRETILQRGTCWTTPRHEIHRIAVEYFEVCAVVSLVKTELLCPFHYKSSVRMLNTELTTNITGLFSMAAELSSPPLKMEIFHGLLT